MRLVNVMTKKYPNAWKVFGAWLGGRTGITIHGTKSGKATRWNTLGCIVTGEVVNDTNDELSGTVEAYERFMWYTGKSKSIFLTIQDQTCTPPTTPVTPTPTATPTPWSSPQPIG